MNKKFRLILMMILVCVNVIYVCGCSCARVTIKVEGGKIVDNSNKVNKGSSVKLECSNIQNFGYWYIEQKTPISFKCEDNFTFDKDVVVKAAPVDEFLIVAFTGQSDESLQTVVKQSDLEKVLKQNNNISDYARYTFTTRLTTNINMPGEIDAEHFEGINEVNFELDLYVPEGGMWTTYKVLLDSDGQYRLVQFGFKDAYDSSYGQKENETSAYWMEVNVTKDSSKSYK